MVLIYSSNCALRWPVNILEMAPEAWYSALPVIFGVFQIGWQTFVSGPVREIRSEIIQEALPEQKTTDLTL